MGASVAGPRVRRPDWEVFARANRHPTSTRGGRGRQAERCRVDRRLDGANRLSRRPAWVTRRPGYLGSVGDVLGPAPSRNV